MGFHNNPDREYKYILHIIDHFSKYSSTFPLTSKEATETAERLAVWIGLFGPPKILQCDNGGEFKGATLALLQSWGIRVINGRPRHPETQGVAEKANSTFKTKLRAWKADSGRSDWAHALPEISLSMNQQKHTTTGQTPYQIVFKQRMHSRRISFADRATAQVITENDSGSKQSSDTDGTKNTTNSESKTLTSSPIINNVYSPVGVPIMQSRTESDSEEGTFHSVQSKDSQHSDEDFGEAIVVREMLSSVRLSTARARSKMANRYNTTHAIAIFNVGDQVTLSIPTKYRSSLTPKRLFCKVIRKPQPHTHELQCVHGILDKCFPTGQLQRTPAGVVVDIGDGIITQKISLACEVMS